MERMGRIRCIEDGGGGGGRRMIPAEGIGLHSLALTMS